MSVAETGLFALLVVVATTAIFAKPRTLLIAGALVAAGAFAWKSVHLLNSVRWCERMLAAYRIIEFDLDGTGDRTIRIHALPESEGLALRLIRLDGWDFEYGSVAGCRWRAVDSVGPVEIDDRALHGMPEGVRRPSRGLVDIEAHDGFGEGDRTWIDLTYRLDDSTRPILRELRLVVLAPRFLRMWGEMAIQVHTILALVFAAAALASIAGAVIQIVRRSRTRRQPSPQAT